MASETTPKTGIAAAMKYFGKRPGEGLAHFKAEWDDLTAADKQEIVADLSDGSLTY